MSLPERFRLTREGFMKEIVSTITSKGQVTIPAEVRRRLGVGTGAKITFVIDENCGERAPRYPRVSLGAGRCSQ